MNHPLERLRSLGYELPAAPTAMAAYVPTRLVPLGEGRGLLFIAGQVPVRDGRFLTGRVPDQVSLEEAREAARLCALNLLAQIEAAVGLEAVIEVAQVNGWVLSADDFQGQPQVIDACSTLLTEVLGEAGRHARTALGTNALPRGVTCEINATVVVRTPVGES
ncbi:MAG TPA: RidA family protein [Candidatus Dormibacteraeota bacterium]|nr:RidA family protein [Candidatus Dormibacteraeota bacterium]